MSKIDSDNPPLTDADFARAVPASAMPAHIRAAFPKVRGRPAGSVKENAKKQIALRVDADVLDAFKATGPGWQTRMNDALRSAIERHTKRRGDAERSMAVSTRR